jgi:hypothetical protein
MAQVWALIEAIPIVVKLVEAAVRSWRVYRLNQRRAANAKKKEDRDRVTKQLEQAQTDEERHALLDELDRIKHGRR